MKVDQTSIAAPSSWNAWEDDGTPLHLEYRYGTGLVHSRGNLVAHFHIGSQQLSVIGLSEFCRRAGLVLDYSADIRDLAAW